MSVLLSRIPGRPGRVLTEGYRFLSKECDRASGDVAQFRLMGLPVTVLRGPAAAKVFYSERLRRKGANPAMMRKTLLGEGTVQSLDGAEHRRRKAMFVSLLAPDRVQGIADEFARQWRHRLPSWALQPRVVLFDEVGEMLCAAICRWAGVPLPERDVRRRTLQLRALIEGPGSVRRQLRGRIARREEERWLGGLIDQVRAAPPTAPASALEVIALHREPDGSLLSRRVAAAELLNVLRPVVAIDRFIVFAALALHDHPEWRRRLAESDDDVEPFVQEVRRFYPFFPAVAGKAAETFTVAGRRVRQGQLVLLDLYGTDHLGTDRGGPWQDPERFAPGRFGDGEPDPFAFVPQGGGDVTTGHRCPGEWTVIAVMRTAVRLLTREMTYSVPEQDLTVRLNRAPALPESHFVITDVRVTADRPALRLAGALD